MPGRVLKLGAKVPSLALLLTSSVLAGPLETGRWLVDLGRDYPLTPQASLTDADGEIALLLMEAAARVAPELASAYRWQYDLLAALDRPEEARQALAAYAERRPGDVAARLQWVELAARTLQDADARARFCARYLERGDVPDSLASDLRRRLAEYHYERGEFGRAEIEASTALRLYPFNLSARLLLQEMRSSRPTPAQRVEVLLAILAMSPGRVDAAWELGDLLMAHRLPLEAEKWYRHAARVIQKVPEQAPPVELYVARCHALLEGGELDQADAIAADLLGREQGAVELYGIRSRVAARQGRAEAARSQIDAAAAAWTSILGDSPGALPPGVLASAAWFFAEEDPQPAEAAKLARAALAEQPDSILAKRALGSALRQQGDLDGARKALEPGALADAATGIAYARVLHAQGETAAAADHLRRAAELPMTGELFEVVTALMKQWEVPVPETQPAASDIRALLDRFPSQVLDYAVEPEKFLRLRVEPAREVLAPGEPWSCTVVLENVGPFPVTIGQEMMVSPDLLCRIESRGDRMRTCVPPVRIGLGERPQLLPGDALKVIETLDIGSLRPAMIATAQVTHEVEVTAVLNPLYLSSEDGRERLVPGIGGMSVGSVRLRRAGLNAGEDTVRGLIARAQSGRPEERAEAMERLAMLLAESQHLAAGRLRYSARPVDAGAIQSAVLSRSEDADWQVRARLCECLRWFSLDDAASRTAIGLAGDAHWLVRGLALRSLADHHRDRFDAVRPILERCAAKDEDAWVRRMARALLDRAAASAATRPM